MRKLITIAFMVAMFSVAAVAHDGAHGMKGTVTAIEANTITIETPTKETHQIHFDDKTTFTQSGAAATVKDLKVGDRVVIEAHDANGTMHAASVRFGKPAKKEGQETKTGADHGGRTPQKDKK